MSASDFFTGSCHCGHIRYTVKFPESVLADPKVGRCNCTWCQKPFFSGVNLTSSSDFKLASPADKAGLGDYTSPGSDQIHRYFCKNCGTHVWREGWYEFQGQHHDYFAVNLCTIDQPQAGIDISKFKVVYTDGLSDNWAAGTKDEPWTGGLA